MVKKTQRSRLFKGDLNKPIDPIKVLGNPPQEPQILLTSKSDRESYEERLAQYDAKGQAFIRSEYDRKLKLLIEHYGLKEGDWFELSLALSMDFIDGFRLVSNPSGRPEIWNPVLLAKLYFDVEAMKASSADRLSLLQICGKIKKILPWSSLGKDITSKTLENTYLKSLRSPFVDAWIKNGESFNLSRDEYLSCIEGMLPNFLPPLKKVSR